MQNTKTMRNYWRDREYRNRKKMKEKEKQKIIPVIDKIGG